MSAIAFPAKGSLGPATQTVWFGALPDRFNMLLKPNSANFFVTDPVTDLSVTRVDFANQATLSGITLGGFTTAPDGSGSTAQLLQEDTSTGKHYIGVCVWDYMFGQHPKPTGPLTLAGYFKNAGRRIIFEARRIGASQGGGGGSDIYMYVIFDLAGGQIGVAPTLVDYGLVGPSYPPISGTASITPAVNGFYLCTFNYCVNSNEAGGGDRTQLTIGLDQGTGTGARNDSYVGNGSSGSYGWRVNQMPTASYSMGNNEIFRDDFTTLATIDVNNTKPSNGINPATGKPFNWFPDGNMTSWLGGAIPVSNAASFNINTPSILTLTPQASTGVNISMTTWTNAGFAAGSPGIGQTWQMPLLIEINLAMDYQNAAWTTGMAFWTIDTKWLIANSNFSPVSGLPVPIIYSEFDFLELLGGGIASFVSHTGGTVIGGTSGYNPGRFTVTGGTAESIPGCELYQAKNTYPSGGTQFTVNGSDGLRYISAHLGTIPPSTPPPNASFWQTSTFNPSASPSGWPPKTFDQSQFHTYSFLLLPYHGSPGCGLPILANGSNLYPAGQFLVFVDGLCTALVLSWTALFNVQPLNQLMSSFDNGGEGGNFLLFIGADVNVPLNIDWVRVAR